VVSRKLTWSKLADKQLNKIIDYIEADSIQNAKKFAQGIAKAVGKAQQNPGHYPPDKFKRQNDGSYRALKIYRYRIIYRIKPDGILILRVRHTKMNPKQY
jgi:plasmid stabilization system protein ParE